MDNMVTSKAHEILPSCSAISLAYKDQKFMILKERAHNFNACKLFEKVLSPHSDSKECRPPQKVLREEIKEYV